MREFSGSSTLRIIQLTPGGNVIVLGVILLVLGYLLPMHLLFVIGAVLLVAGAVLYVLGHSGRSVGPRSHYW